MAAGGKARGASTRSSARSRPTIITTTEVPPPLPQPHCNTQEPSSPCTQDDGFQAVRRRRDSACSGTSTDTAASRRDRPDRPYAVDVSRLPAELSTQKSLTAAVKSIGIVIERINVYKNTARIQSYTSDFINIIRKLNEIAGFPLAYSSRPPINNSSQPAPKPKTYSCVMRGVEHDVNDDDVQTAAKAAGLSIKNLWRIVSRATGKPTMLYRLITACPSTLRSLLTRGLCIHENNTYYKCEESNPPAGQPIQCAKCFKFGHKLNDCNSSTTCPKCSGNHQRVDCRAAPSTLKCPNCGGDHEAFSHKCPQRPAAPDDLQAVQPIVCANIPACEESDDEEVDEISPKFLRTTDAIRFVATALLDLFPNSKTRVQATVAKLARDLLRRWVKFSYSGSAVHITCSYLDDHHG